MLFFGTVNLQLPPLQMIRCPVPSIPLIFEPYEPPFPHPLYIVTFLLFWGTISANIQLLDLA